METLAAEELRTLNAHGWNSVFSPDGKWLAMASGDSVKLCDVERGTELPTSSNRGVHSIVRL